MLNIGGALIRDAVHEISGVADEQWQQLLVQWGESGLAAAQVLGGQVATAPALSLRDMQGFYAALHQARGPRQKRPVVVALLRQCTVLEATYAIKLMLGGDLRIGLQEGQLEDSLARIHRVPVVEVQWTNMLLGDIGETARLLRHGQHRTARLRMFHPIKFMLASPVQDSADAAEAIPLPFFVEDKYDGVRVQVHKTDERVALYSRTLDEVTHRFPEVIETLRALPGDFILDGEILAVRGDQILSFKTLQARLGRKIVSDEVQAAAPVIYVAFDILYRDGTVLLNHPLYQRRTSLTTLIEAGGYTIEVNPIYGVAVTPSLQLFVKYSGRIDALFDAARARGNEGLMIKDPNSPYRPGRRGREWIKVKKAMATLDVVVVAAEVGNGQRRRFLSDYTFAIRKSATDPELLTIGKAYGGLTDVEVQELTDWFQAHMLEDRGRLKVVEPQIVFEVAFDLIQPSSRHSSGYALRFPRIVTWRRDKPATEIDTLETVQHMAGEPTAEALHERAQGDLGNG
ncbi:MAG: ATP-dependent DNA ligase [Herpetosiphon sp.]